MKVAALLAITPLVDGQFIQSGKIFGKCDFSCPAKVVII